MAGRHIRYNATTKILEFSTTGDGTNFNPLELAQILFPASQLSSSNSNTLDDYEWGTWTPILGGSGGTSGQTYAWNNGYYIKVGRFVFVNWDIKFTAKGTITGSLRITGLPFTIGNVTRNYPPVFMGLWQILAIAQVQVSGYGELNGTHINIFGATGALASLAAFSTAELGNDSQLLGALIYRAAT